MSDWKSLNEIMRDLSVAQGRVVPASLEAIGDCAPPIANIQEETEEEFYKSCGDVDFSKPPDFLLIQEMLSKVHEEKILSEAESDCDILLNSNLNPLSSEFVPGEKCAKKKTNKPKRVRNIAMESIFKILKENSETQSNGKLSTEMLKSPLGMFKSKCKKENVIIEIKEAKSEIVNSNREYVPSELAQVYYNKYLENDKLKKKVTQDMWEKAEQKMRELAEKELLREESPTPSSSVSGRSTVSEGTSTSTTTGSSSCFKYGLYRVALEHYRHFSTEVGDCVVCEVAEKHGYHFEDQE